MATKTTVANVVEPWPDPVDGAGLVAELEAAIKRFVIMPAPTYLVVSLWALFTWVLEAFEISPRLHLRSPEKKCGKTTLIKVLQRLVRKPLAVSRVTPSAFIRSIKTEQPTLLIDETDAFLRDNEILRGLIDSGHEIETAFVLMSVPRGDTWIPEKFPVFTPMLLASIGSLADTIEDRSIAIGMRRRKPSETVDKARRQTLKDLAPLARKCCRWALDNIELLRNAKPLLPAELDDRAADNFEPLLAIADVIGGDIPTRAREAAIVISGSTARPPDSLGSMLLEDIAAIFELTAEKHLSSQFICGRLADFEGRPWAELSRGKPITANKLARSLKPFSIRPFSDGHQHVYDRDDFADAWSRYLPAATSSAPTPPNSTYNPDSKADAPTDASKLSSSPTGITASDSLTVQTPTTGPNAGAEGANSDTPKIETSKEPMSDEPVPFFPNFEENPKGALTTEVIPVPGFPSPEPASEDDANLKKIVELLRAKKNAKKQA